MAAVHSPALQLLESDYEEEEAVTREDHIMGILAGASSPAVGDSLLRGHLRETVRPGQIGLLLIDPLIASLGERFLTPLAVPVAFIVLDVAVMLLLLLLVLVVVPFLLLVMVVVVVVMFVGVIDDDELT